MDELIRDCREQIPKAFEGKKYESRKTEAMQHLEEQPNRLFTRLHEKAAKLDHARRMCSLCWV